MRTSPLRSIHEAADARLQPEVAGGEVITYGDVPAEYAAGAGDGALLFDRTTRGLISIGGGDAKDFLHRILANEIKGIAAGKGNRNLLLTGKGKVVHLFDLADLGEGYLLSTEPGAAPALLEALDMYLFTEDVQMADESEVHAPLEIVGGGAHGVLATVLEGMPDERGEEHSFHLALFNGVPTKVTTLSVAGRPGWRISLQTHKYIGIP